MRDDLPHAMRETARGLDPDVARLTAGGVSRGTRMRRVERIVQVLGSVVAVAVVFAGVVLFGSHRGAGANQTTVPGTDNTLPTRPPGKPTRTVPSPTAPTATTPFPSGAAPLSDADLAAALKTALSGTGVTGESYVAHGSADVPSTTFVSMSPIMVAAQLAAPPNDAGFLQIVFSAPGASVPRPGQPRPLADGSVVYANEASASTYGGTADRLTLQVTLVRTDGSSLAAYETNSSTDKSAAAPNAPLLLTSDQLTAMLDSSTWDAAIGAADAVAVVDVPPSSSALSAGVTP